MAKAIAMAVSHPFGIGDAKYRLRKGTAEQEAVDTVAFACFKKELWRDIGGFDEELLTNEDYEFNYRVRLNGKTVLLDRAEHCDYFARTTLKGLFLQYSRYGTWKARMIRRHPRSVKWRHVVAPAFVASLPILLAAGFWLRPAWWLAPGWSWPSSCRPRSLWSWLPWSSSSSPTRPSPSSGSRSGCGPRGGEA